MRGKSRRPKFGALMLEVTGRCNHDCIYCYNVWRKGQGYVPTELDTERWKRLIDTAVEQADFGAVSFTGGEPFLREDLAELVRYASEEHSLKANVISNGTLITKPALESLRSAGLTLLEITVLSHDPSVHARLTGRDTLRSALAGASLAEKLDVPLVIGTVGTRINIGDMAKVADIAFALSAKGLMFNRFNPGGRGISHMAELMPTKDQLAEALAVLDRKSKEYMLPVTANVPIPPCVLDMKKFKRIRFGYCPAGGAGSYYTVSPSGEIRACNHSSRILGMAEEIGIIVARGAKNPPFHAMCLECADCADLKKCNASCRASSDEVHGEPSTMDPFVDALRISGHTSDTNRK